MSSRQSNGPEEGFEDPPAAFAEFAVVVEPLLLFEGEVVAGVAVVVLLLLEFVVVVSVHVSFVGFDIVTLLL